MWRSAPGVSILLFWACGTSGGSPSVGGASNGPPADAGISTESPDAGTSPAADGGATGGTAPDAGVPTFALRILLRGQGVVTSDPSGIDCPSTCESQFAVNQKIVLNATPTAGWSFSGWDGACFGPTCVVDKLPGKQVVGAAFTQDPPPANVSSYTIVAIPPVMGASGGTFGSLAPTSINSSGQVVGGFNDCLSINFSECDHGPFSAFLYDPAKGSTVRIAIPDATDHAAKAINDAGAIIFDGNPYGVDDGFVLSNGTATHLGQDAFASGINSKGWVSGSIITPDARQYAFLWDGTSVRPLAPSPSVSGGLNAAGVVVGSVQFRASVFAAGAVQVLGVLPGDTLSMAVAINDHGRVVGVSSDNFPIERAFVFDLPNGPLRDVVPGGSSSLSGVNAAGDAVGSILHLNSPVSAILWHDGTVIDLTRALNDPSWQLVSATAINDKGQICGVAIHDGGEYAYVLTPK
jgi:uncharacterized membrane protein